MRGERFGGTGTGTGARGGTRIDGGSGEDGVDDDGNRDGDGDGNDAGMDSDIDKRAGKQRPRLPSRQSSLSMPGHVGQRRSSLSASTTTTSSSQTARTSYSQPGSSQSHYTPSQSRSQSPFSNILATLQPKLDKARYKAEAGLSRRGFVGPVGGGSGDGWDGDGDRDGDGDGEWESRKGRSGRGGSSVLSGEELEEREGLVVHAHGQGHLRGSNGFGFGHAYDAPGVDMVPNDDLFDSGSGTHPRRGGSSSSTGGIGTIGGGIGGGGGVGGTLNGVGGAAVLDSDDSAGGDEEGEGEGEGKWRKEVKERWGADVRDKDGLKLPAGEGWRPLA